MSIFITDASGNKIGSSTTDEIEQSVIIDQYGQQILSNFMVIGGVRINRYPNVHGFYRLNDIHDKLKGSWMCPSDAVWKRYAPNQWYRPASPNAKLNGFFNQMAGYCTINEQSAYKLTAQKVNIPTYVMFDPAGNLNYTDIESSVRPYPIEVIRGGTSPGTYGPILTVIKYAAWISPELELKVYDTYNRHANFTGNMTQLLTESKIDDGSNGKAYHTVKEAEYRFNTSYDQNELERECVNHEYGSTVVHNPLHGDLVRTYHRDIWWLAYKIPSDKW